MCWLLTYFLVLIQDEFRVICDWWKVCPCLFSESLLPHLHAHLWRNYLQALLLLFEPWWHWFTPLKINLPQDYAVCLFLSYFLFQVKLLVVLVVLGFNATLTANVMSLRSLRHMCFLAFLIPVRIYLSFESHRLLFSRGSPDVRGEDTPERKFASTGYRTHNHQVMSPTRSPLGHPGGVTDLGENGRKKKYHGLTNISLCFSALTPCPFLHTI